MPTLSAKAQVHRSRAEHVHLMATGTSYSKKNAVWVRSDAGAIATTPENQVQLQM
tara:strand:+ start:114 stop:278 length:165 start_codon:yes stop_codon:yes gene_type:complete